MYDWQLLPVIFSCTRTRSRTQIKAISSLELELELKIFSELELN